MKEGKSHEAREMERESTHTRVQEDREKETQREKPRERD